MTYSVVRTVYYGPDRTMYRGRILEGASFDEARDCITRWCDWDLCFLNGRHGDGAYTDMPLWPARNHCVHITRIAPSLKYCGSFSESQPREIVYEIWEEAEQDKNIKEENIMTNAEMAKQIKEFAEKLDRYYANQEETINKYDDKIVHLHNELEKLAEKVDGLGIVAQETTRQLHEIRNTSEAHLKVENQKMQEQSDLNTTWEEVYQHHRTLDDWNSSGREKPEKSSEICDAGFDGIIDNIVDSDEEE